MKIPSGSCNLVYVECSVNVSHMELCTVEGESPVQHSQEFLVRHKFNRVG